jgi:hypothetical protein
LGEDLHTLNLSVDSCKTRVKFVLATNDEVENKSAESTVLSQNELIEIAVWSPLNSRIVGEAILANSLECTTCSAEFRIWILVLAHFQFEALPFTSFLTFFELGPWKGFASNVLFRTESGYLKYDPFRMRVQIEGAAEEVTMHLLAFGMADQCRVKIISYRQMSHTGEWLIEN